MERFRMFFPIVFSKKEHREGSEEQGSKAVREQEVSESMVLRARSVPRKPRKHKTTCG
jgi:hypothetical protein